MTTPVSVIKTLARAMRGMSYDERERSEGEASPAYRNGWNDAMRAAVRYVLSRVTVEFSCSRDGCTWSARSTGDKEVSRLTASYARCPQCAADLVVSEVAL